MPEQNIRLSIETAEDHTGTVFYWVVQQTAPVRTLFQCPGEGFATRADALADFQAVCDALGWNNDITEVPVR